MTAQRLTVKSDLPGYNGFSAAAEKKIHPLSKLQPFSSNKIRKIFSIFQTEVSLGSIELHPESEREMSQRKPRISSL